MVFISNILPGFEVSGDIVGQIDYRGKTSMLIWDCHPKIR
jgi:hypothetical protein